MPTIDLELHSDFNDWQPIARYLLTNEITPDQVDWSGGMNQDLFANTEETLSPRFLPEPNSKKTVRISRGFVELARFVASHSNPDRFDLLYRLLWRIYAGEKGLLADSLDPMMKRANEWAKNVGRDRHKMQAFVRFREVRLRDIQNEKVNTAKLKTPGESDIQKKSYNANAQNLYIAWFEPEHYILKLNADFFCRRFYNMDWSILSPYQSLHWYQKSLYVGSGADLSQLPQDDVLEDYWRCYYAHIFNPARLKVKAMCREMPKKYWHNLPEAPLIPHLVNSANHRTEAMLTAPTHEQGKLPSNTRFNREEWLDKKKENYSLDN